MPELPDVEIVRRRLEKGLLGATIVAASSDDRRVLRPGSPRAFSRALSGRAVREVGRKGKWLRIVLDDGSRLFSHLGMTGWWTIGEPASPARPSERARIDVEHDGRSSSARYLDSRRFGRLVVANRDIPEWSELGPDPLADGVDLAALASVLGGSRRAVKDVLMDQTTLAGIGNILATEGLWHARIDPRSPGNALSPADIHAIVQGLGKALHEELAVREAAHTDDWEDVFAVYGHKGEPCPRCGTRIQSVVIGGRTSAYCKHCQVRKRAGRARGARRRA